jgi:alcohol dehydrogenase class IV
LSLNHSQWNYPTTIWFGNGRIAELPAACAELNIKAPLLVTDKGLTGLEMIANALSALQAAGLSVALFDQVQGNPVAANVSAGVAAYDRGAHDGVIAFGGGSALDVGKSVALMAGQQRKLWDFEDRDDNWLLADAALIPPIIAVPTTAGTGSEVGRAAVILDEQVGQKKVIFHPAMLPSLVLSDPQLTVGLPADITAWTGVDAFVHALEAFLAPGFHPMADGIAVEAMRLVKRYLPAAVADGTDLEARGNMLTAASMGAAAFQKGLGSIHSVSHAVGALYNSHHGLTNAIVLPYGVYQNAPVIEEKLRYLCRVLELPGVGASAFIDFLQSFCAELDIPQGLSSLGIDESRAEEVGRLAASDPTAATNARPVGCDELQQLFRAAVHGSFEPLG